MHVVTRGSGPPLVLVPGIQGRWAYMRATVEALARRFAVLTFDLGRERRGDDPWDRTAGLDAYAGQIGRALDAARVDRAVVCGVSFGAVAALRFAATHSARVAALVLASAPGPAWHLSARHRRWARRPWLFGPLFLVETPLKLRKEIATALPRRRDRWALGGAQLGTALGTGFSLTHIADRARTLDAADTAGDCARVAAPTLVVTGEPGLDHVVPVSGSSEYVGLIPGARGAVLERTGHLGSVTRPDAFTELIAEFVAGLPLQPRRRREGCPPNAA